MYIHIYIYIYGTYGTVFKMTDFSLEVPMFKGSLILYNKVQQAQQSSFPVMPGHPEPFNVEASAGQPFLEIQE